MSICKESMGRALEIIKNYDAVIWAGSGLSLYAGYPSGGDLCQKILNSAESEVDKEILRKYKNSLMDISNEFSQIYSRDKLMSIIKSEFDLKPKCEPKVHIQLSKIPQIDTIITTNYDHLFEIAYGENITVCVGTNFKKSEKGKAILYKIHGDTSDDIIITSMDYSQFYEKLDTILWDKVKSIIAERSVIFIGYSLEDKNIQDIFEKILKQIDSSNKEFFIVTPELPEYKLKYYNKMCKITHIPMTGEAFIKYVEEQVRKNILVDAMAKKIPIDEAYRVCRERGITPTIINKPNGNTTKPIVDKVELTSEVFFKYITSSVKREFTLKSSPNTNKKILDFINNCDCKEITVPAKDAMIVRNINGICIPESQIIDGKFADDVKLEKQEVIEKLNLVLGEQDINVVIRGFWGRIKSRYIIELSCINISIEKNYTNIKLEINFKYPHSSENAIYELKKLKLWVNGNNMIFKNNKNNVIFQLSSSSLTKEQNKDTLDFINENISLYEKIASIEKNQNSRFILKEELKTEDIKNICRLYESNNPQVIEYSKINNVDKGKLTLKQIEEYKNNHPMRVTIEFPQQLPEDCFKLLDKYICLGRRKITLIKPVITNMSEAEKMILNNQNVCLKVKSKINKAKLEFI